jgi:hypothetical protein
MSSVHAVVVIALAIVLGTWLVGLLRGKGIMP